MTDALENIARSSSFQENQYFINDIPIFKAKDPQCFDDWLEQTDHYQIKTPINEHEWCLDKAACHICCHFFFNFFNFTVFHSI